jgi:glutaredoxin 3
MKFLIYSKPNCSFCTRAKALLTVKGYEYYEQILGEDYTRDDLLSWFPNARTVPQIELEDEGSTTYIGGYTELVSYLEKNSDRTS